MRDVRLNYETNPIQILRKNRGGRENRKREREKGEGIVSEAKGDRRPRVAGTPRCNRKHPLVFGTADTGARRGTIIVIQTGRFQPS